MKHALKAVALAGLLVGSSSLMAAETYGPVLKVKPQGVAAETAESKPRPGASGDIKNPHGSQPAGLLVPAVQKVREAAPRSGNGQGEAIQGGLDRDIIRQVPGKPKPTK